MPGFYFSDLQMFFIHIPKNGGNSVFNALNEVGDISRFFPIKDGLEKMRWHTSASWVRAQNPELWDSCYSFTFVRNPWDRLVSLWNHVMEDRNMFCYVYGIDRLDNISYGYLYSREKEKTFSEWLISYDVPFVFRKGYQIDNPELLPATKTQQMNWIYGRNGRKIVTEVFKLEESDYFVSRMKEQFGIDISFGHYNLRNHDHYKSYYTDELIDLVGEWFRDDIEEFGYYF